MVFNLAMASMKAKQVQRMGKVAQATGAALKRKSMSAQDGEVDGSAKKVRVMKKPAAAGVPENLLPTGKPSAQGKKADKKAEEAPAAKLAVKGKKTEKKAEEAPAAKLAVKGKKAEKKDEEAKQVKPVKRLGKVAKAVGTALKRKSMSKQDEVAPKKARTMKKPAAEVAAEEPSVKGKKTEKKVKQDPKEQEAATVAARTKELKAMAIAELKDLAKSLHIEPGLKTEMLEKVLAHEVKGREELRAVEAKRRVIVASRRTELAGKSKTELKELCEKKGLKTGGSKDEQVERILTDAQEKGEIDEVLATMARDVRRTELASLDKAALKKLCDKNGLDPLVKEVMVERILNAENKSK